MSPQASLESMSKRPPQAPLFLVMHADIKGLSAKVDELLEKQTDVHAIMKFFKTREQIDSLRRPVQKSEIKIKIPEEVAGTLKPRKTLTKKTQEEGANDA